MRVLTVQPLSHFSQNQYYLISRTDTTTRDLSGFDLYTLLAGRCVGLFGGTIS